MFSRTPALAPAAVKTECTSRRSLTLTVSRFAMALGLATEPVKWSGGSIVHAVQLVGPMGNAGQLVTLAALKFGWHTMGFTQPPPAQVCGVAQMCPQKPQLRLSARV